MEKQVFRRQVIKFREDKLITVKDTKGQVFKTAYKDFSSFPLIPEPLILRINFLLRIRDKTTVQTQLTAYTAHTAHTRPYTASYGF